MKASLMTRFLRNFHKDPEVGFLVCTSKGDEFWSIGEDTKILAGGKALSLLTVRLNDPPPQGASISNLKIKFDSAPLDPDLVIAGITARFNIDTNGQEEAAKKLSNEALTDVMFEALHKEIGELIKLNNDLIMYVKNRYQKQKKYYIAVAGESKDANEHKK